MKVSVENKIVVGFGMSVLVLIGIGWLAYRTTTNLTVTEIRVSHTHEVIATLENGLAIHCHDGRAEGKVDSGETFFFSLPKTQAGTKE